MPRRGERRWEVGPTLHNTSYRTLHIVVVGVPRKTIIGIPWRVALEMVKRGWILRSPIVWTRTGAIPEPTDSARGLKLARCPHRLDEPCQVIPQHGFMCCRNLKDSWGSARSPIPMRVGSIRGIYWSRRCAVAASVLFRFRFCHCFVSQFSWREPQFFVLARFLPFVSVPVFLGKRSRQDRVRATISDSVDPQHSWFCLSSVAFHFSKVRHEIGRSSVCSKVLTLWAT